MNKGKYWFVEFEDGEICGVEREDPITAEEAMRIVYEECGGRFAVSDAWRTTKYEMYFSEVDIL